MLIEDDEGIAGPLVRALGREGYDVEWFQTGLPGLDAVIATGPDAVILDLGLPDVDGLEVCRLARERGYGGAILILTARGDELDRVVGLDSGADDYLAKPFGLAELLARIRAALRRSPGTQAPAGPSTDASALPGGLRIDDDAHRCWVGDDEVELSTKEFAILSMLAASLGKVVSRDRFMDEVWDEHWYGSTKTLDVTIGRLRQKLGSAGSDARITAVRGVGFRLDDPDA